jgi:hypothetical protein
MKTPVRIVDISRARSFHSNGLRREPAKSAREAKRPPCAPHFRARARTLCRLVTAKGRRDANGGNLAGSPSAAQRA